jgi:uncharacterized membrane protein
MTWLQRYRLREFLQTSLWYVPLLGMLLGILGSYACRWLDAHVTWTWTIAGPEGARAAIGAIASALLTMIVFVLSMLLLAVQIASAQMTPRIINRALKDRGTKLALGIFSFSYTLSLGVMARIENSVAQISAFVSAYGSLVSLAVFLYLIDRLARSLRPVSILAGVAAEGRQVIRTIYPHRLADKGVADQPVVVTPGAPVREIDLSGAPGVVLAFDTEGLVELARQADCVIELVPQVGDFVATDDPLFLVHGDGPGITEAVLSRHLALGGERTLEQDPAFAFRIIVDIASKALSPAINDPTTAVLALDQVHHLLRQVGERRLAHGQVRDAQGRLRLVYRTPNWEDFVCLAVTEIRQFGAESIQVNRRLRAMLESLIKILPEQRAAALRRELSLVHRAVERVFTDPEDRERADVGDSQGVGGSPSTGQAGTARREGN